MTINAFLLLAAEILLLLGSSVGTHTQNPTPSVRITVCDLYTSPEKYAGRMIEVRTTITGDHNPRLEEPTFAPQNACAASGYMTIGLELPENITPKPEFNLVRDERFQKYLDSLQKPVRIEAVLEGRFDPVFIWRNHRRERIGEGEGFGNKHGEDARLVLHKVLEVETRHLPSK